MTKSTTTGTETTKSPYRESVTGKVVRVIRHGHTLYGNPMMSIVLDTDGWGETHRISNNAGIVYGIENPEYRETAHTFELTRAGRISGRVMLAAEAANTEGN